MGNRASSNIACTNILRTLLDLGAVDRRAVPDAAGHAIANHHIALATLETVVIQHSEHGRTGIVALRDAVDDWAYHGLQRTTFERDRDRDADLIAAGWIVVRFTYRAVTARAKATADRIAAAVARWS